MKIYSSFNSVPELRDLPRSEQTRLWTEAREHLFALHGRKMFYAFRLFIVGLFALSIVIGSWIPREWDLWLFFGSLSSASAFTIVSMQLHMHACRPKFRQIRERDYGENWSNEDSPPVG